MCCAGLITRVITDEQLVEESLAGSTLAFSELVERYQERLLRYLLTRSENRADAEDAVQAVLVGVAARPKLLAAAKCPWSYLLQMVRNEALGILWRKKRCSLVSNLNDLLTRRLVDVAQDSSFAVRKDCLHRHPFAA